MQHHWGDTVPQLIELLPHSTRDLSSIPTTGAVRVEFAHSVTTWASSRDSNFLAHPKDVQFCGLIGLYIAPNEYNADEKVG